MWDFNAKPQSRKESRAEHRRLPLPLSKIGFCPTMNGPQKMRPLQRSLDVGCDQMLEVVGHLGSSFASLRLCAFALNEHASCNRGSGG
jgi:hypothetical protein